uniref:uncharacterized protein LOC125397505 n=1 Tax=Myodes glareolus TaxID=447135 RepID=UPI0020214770|nr:uncharacterized protein LOC125397505 [Myodes glareolus]
MAGSFGLRVQTSLANLRMASFPVCCSSCFVSPGSCEKLARRSLSWKDHVLRLRVCATATQLCKKDKPLEYPVTVVTAKKILLKFEEVSSRGRQLCPLPKPVCDAGPAVGVSGQIRPWEDQSVQFVGS